MKAKFAVTFALFTLITHLSHAEQKTEFFTYKGKLWAVNAEPTELATSMERMERDCLYNDSPPDPDRKLRGRMPSKTEVMELFEAYKAGLVKHNDFDSLGVWSSFGVDFRYSDGSGRKWNSRCDAAGQCTNAPPDGNENNFYKTKAVSACIFEDSKNLAAVPYTDNTFTLTSSRVEDKQKEQVEERLKQAAQRSKSRGTATKQSLGPTPRPKNPCANVERGSCTTTK